MSRIYLFLLALCISISYPSFAEEPEKEKDWPCDQILIPEISLTAVWSGPKIDKEINDWWKDDDVYKIVEELKEPSLTEDEAIAMIDTFAGTVSGDKKKKLLLVFAGLFEKTNDLRKIQIRGIKRFVRRQNKVTAGISEASSEIRKLRTGKADSERLYEDPEMIEQSKKLEWNARVHDERAKLTPYICDEPVLALERLAVRSKAILKYLK